MALKKYYIVFTENRIKEDEHLSMWRLLLPFQEGRVSIDASRPCIQHWQSLDSRTTKVFIFENIDDARTSAGLFCDNSTSFGDKHLFIEVAPLYTCYADDSFSSKCTKRPVHAHTKGFELEANVLFLTGTERDELILVGAELVKKGKDAIQRNSGFSPPSPLKFGEEGIHYDISYIAEPDILTNAIDNLKFANDEYQAKKQLKDLLQYALNLHTSRWSWRRDKGSQLISGICELIIHQQQNTQKFQGEQKPQDLVGIPRYLQKNIEKITDKPSPFSLTRFINIFIKLFGGTELHTSSYILFDTYRFIANGNTPNRKVGTLLLNRDRQDRYEFRLGNIISDDLSTAPPASPANPMDGNDNATKTRK